MSTQRMADYDYGLPEGAIAQVPADPRDAARLLVALEPGPPTDHHVHDLPDLLGPGDVLVVNDTRVLPARLALRKITGGYAEVLLLKPAADGTWEALVRPGRRIPAGTVLHSPAGDAVIEVGDPVGSDGNRRVRLLTSPWSFGRVPLPPYIHEPLADPERYQTVYSVHDGSVAAPTAGLHLTHGVLDACRSRGVNVVSLDLQVGLDTFRPITVEDPDEHRMHAETYRVPEATWIACKEARRVVAVGTTTTRALESVGRTGELQGRTDLFIRRGFPFTVVDVLLTNFHMPRSTLLLLVEAFVGDRWRDLYRVALSRDYRFLSFGDAMLLGRTHT